MATLTYTNTHIAGTPAKASEVNQNDTDTVNWSTTIANDNFGTFSGAVNWAIVSGVKAIDISNAGDEGSIEVTQTAALNPSKSGVKIEHTAAEVSGDAGLFIDFTSAGSTIPLLRLDNAGSGEVIKARDASADRWSLKLETGQVDYNTFTTDDHVWNIAGSEQMRLDETGKLTVKTIDPTDGFGDILVDSIQFEDGSGPTLTKDAATATILAEFGFKLGDAAGPTITKDGAGNLLLKDTLQIGASGPTLSQETVDLRVDGGIFLGASGTAIIARGNIDDQVIIKDKLILGASNRAVLRGQSNLKGIAISDASNTFAIVVGANDSTSSTPLRMLRATVESGGAVTGEGFDTANAKDATGQYSLVFTTPFLSTPTVTATPASIIKRVAIVGISTIGVSINVGDADGSTATDGKFHFIVMGPR